MKKFLVNHLGRTIEDVNSIPPSYRLLDTPGAAKVLVVNIEALLNEETKKPPEFGLAELDNAQ